MSLSKILTCKEYGDVDPFLQSLRIISKTRLGYLYILMLRHVLLKVRSVIRYSPEGSVGGLRAILRLNEAGRRYLIQDGSSISKGVEVLSRVNIDINCVFLHLLETRSFATDAPWRW
jgi:hypothetical protein